jgi:hypothetical protein
LMICTIRDLFGDAVAWPVFGGIHATWTSTACCGREIGKQRVMSAHSEPLNGSNEAWLDQSWLSSCFSIQATWLEKQQGAKQHTMNLPASSECGTESKYIAQCQPVLTTPWKGPRMGLGEIGSHGWARTWLHVLPNSKLKRRRANLA